jgi:hypothetical protein
MPADHGLGLDHRDRIENRGEQSVQPDEDQPIDGPDTISLPALLQSLFGYDATTSGLVLSPSGIFAIIMLVVVGAYRAESMPAI